MTKIPYVAHIIEWTSSFYLQIYCDSPRDAAPPVDLNVEQPVEHTVSCTLERLRCLAKDLT